MKKIIYCLQPMVFVILLSISISACQHQQQSSHLSTGAASTVKTDYLKIESDNPRFCQIHQQCQYLRSFDCRETQEDFDRKCTRTFKRMMKRYDGDTYVYNTAPKLDPFDGKMYVYADIYKCSNEPLNVLNKIKRKLHKKPNNKIYLTKMIPKEYQEKCGVLNGCQASMNMRCLNESKFPLRNCYVRLKKGMIYSGGDALLLNDLINLDNTDATDHVPGEGPREGHNTDMRYQLSATSYVCDGSRSKLLPPFVGKSFKRQRKHVPENYQITVDAINKYTLTGKEVAVEREKRNNQTDVLFEWRGIQYSLAEHPSDLLVEQLKHQLKQQGFVINPDAKKKLKVSVLKIKPDFNKWRHTSRIVFSTVYGNKRHKKRLDNETWFDMGENIRQSTDFYIVNLLNDENLRRYLSEP